MFEDLINFIENASKDEIIKILKDNGVKFKSDIMEDNMNKELEILKLQNRIALLQGRTEKDNKNVQRKCLRKLKKLQEQ